MIFSKWVPVSVVDFLNVARTALFRCTVRVLRNRGAELAHLRVVLLLMPVSLG